MYILKMYFPAAFTPFCSQEIAYFLGELDRFTNKSCKLEFITNDRIEVLSAWIRYLAPVDFDETDPRVRIVSVKQLEDFDRKTVLTDQNGAILYCATFPHRFQRDPRHFLEILEQISRLVEVSKETAQPLPIDPLVLISGFSIGASQESEE